MLRVGKGWKWGRVKAGKRRRVKGGETVRGLRVGKGES